MKALKVFLILLLIVIIGLRLAFPYYLLNYVEKQINKIPGYHVKIADLDVALIAGAYTLRNLELWKKGDSLPVPFFSAQSIRFSPDYRQFLRGKVLGKIEAETPHINFVSDPNGQNEQLTISKEWLQVVKTLYPANINSTYAHNGTVNLISYKGHPPYKIYIKHSELELVNMQNAERKGKMLSSRFSFRGDVIGGGNINTIGKFDPFDKIPTFKMQSKMISMNIASIAPFLKHYTDVDVTGGELDMYSETVAADGRIHGYVKPFLRHLKIGGNKIEGPINAAADVVASVAAKLLENPKQKTIATKIEINGDVNDPETSTLSIIGYLIQHAYIHALLPQIDNSVKMEDISFGKARKSSSKFPRYKP